VSGETPEGWVSCKIGEVTQIVSGGTPPSKDLTNFITEGGIPWITPADLSGYRSVYISRGARNLSEKGFFACSANKIPQGSVLFSSRAPVGYVAIAANELTTNQGFKSFVLPDSLDSRFVYFYLKHIKPIAEAMATGTTFKELSGSVAAQLPLVIAPLNEQRLIADKLDALLARVGACRDRLDRVPLILKKFRQTVIDLAVSGKLTETWRESNHLSNEVESIQIESTGDFFDVINSFDYVISDSWVWLTPDLIKSSEKHSLSIGPFGSDLTVRDYKNAGIPLIFVRDIRTKSFSGKTTKFISEEKAQKLWAHRVEPGDLLITKMGDPPGDVAIFPSEQPIAIITADCIRIKVNPEIVSIKMLALFIESSLVRSLIKVITAGVAQQKISLQRFRSMPLPIPPLDEQQEIVRCVESLFAYTDHLETRYQNACNQVEQLAPRLLAKAFRGELVPQNANDEPASVLFERIRTEREGQPIKPKMVLTHRKPKMSKMSKESVKEVIRQLPNGTFSFEELYEKIPLKYDDFKDILFTLLDEDEPSIMQVFDQEAQAMYFVKEHK
jgi:type I restriction enzyme, S subunit